MQVKKLRELFQQYQSFLRSPRAAQRLPYWESQLVFQQNWDPGAEDLPAMIDRSLQNSRTRRIWKRENWEPKRMLLALARQDPEYLRQAFRDLFDEGKELEGRLNRFLFYADELLEQHRKAHPLSIDTGHYLEDYEFLFLLLAFRYPDRYAPYPAAAFRHLLEKALAPNISPTHDPARFAKVTRTLYTLMEKEADLLALSHRRLGPEHFREKSLLPVFDLLLATDR